MRLNNISNWFKFIILLICSDKIEIKWKMWLNVSLDEIFFAFFNQFVFVMGQTVASERKWISSMISRSHLIVSLLKNKWSKVNWSFFYCLIQLTILMTNYHMDIAIHLRKKINCNHNNCNWSPRKMIILLLLLLLLS